MHLLTRIVAVAGLLALGLTASIPQSHNVFAAPAVVGHVYINDNTAGANTIGAFNRFSDGSLVAMPGSPFAAGGAGTGTVIGSQGSLQVTADGRYLLAADAGSNQISVLRIRPDGSLRPVEDSPISSGGTSPVTIAIHGSLVYVGNSGATSNYTGFTLNQGGHLRPLNNSTFALPSGTTPGDVLFSGDGTHLAGTRVGTGAGAATLPSEIDSFSVDKDGTLVPAPDSPFPAQGAGPFGSEFRPTNPNQLFVSNAHDGTNNGTISAFSVESNGNLDSIGASPYPDNNTAPCWVEISHDGKYLYTVNTATSVISYFSIATDGSLTLRTPTTLNDASGLRPFDARLDPSGGYLYVVDAGRDAVSALAVNPTDGSLMELSSSPFAGPTGATPFGLVVT
jgi:6-phosphogluconolactonase